MSVRASINALLVMMLALRSLMPAGFMVQAAAAASDLPFEIVICTSTGPKLLHPTGTDSPAAPQKSQALGDGLCPFAATGAAALAEEPQTLAGVVEYATVTYTLAAALFAETPKPGAVSARGPPSLLI